MKQFLLRHKNSIGYTLYGIILVLALLFFLFPSDMVRDYIQSSVHNQFPGVLITFQKASPCLLPAGLKLKEVECRIQGPPEQTVFTADEIIIRPRIWSLIRNNPEYLFTLHAYDGTVAGNIRFQKSSSETMFNSSAEFDNIHLDEKSGLPAFIKDYVTGILEGTFTFSGGDLLDPNGTGQASLALSKGSFKLIKPLGNITTIDIRELLLKADLRDRNLNISDIDLKGTDFLAKASGTINIKNPFKKSPVNIKGTIEPTAAFMRDAAKGDSIILLIKQTLKNGRLPFTINGTIEKYNFGLT